MGSSTEAVDAVTADVVRGFEFRGDDEVLSWWQIMRRAREEANGDIEDLVNRVRAAVLDASFDERMVDEFAVAVSSGGIDLVERIIALEQWMPDFYWTLRNPVEEAQGGEIAGEWEWVTAAQVALLHGYWGDQWPDQLAPWLDERWGTGWEQNPAEHRATWLDALVQELAAPEEAAEEAAAPPFAWVRPEQADAVTGIWGVDWHDPMRRHLDSRWGAGWDDNPDDHKVAWLNDLLTEWSAGASSGEQEPAAQPPTSELSYDQVMEQAFASALEKVPGAADLPDDEIARARATFAAEFERTHPRPVV
ncbi:hypothetical protein [Actinophytocola algeriensis]|uniref:Uncharacterized protein n=1 Tax=Actinophytocola algeriensis TaxID=1768010 RepID=A0A7W7VDE1_9PSEU|nr:hypothetical protein [Actinophytocola algeriensis]MBB4906103.1 hypothetical protein [Actinophytocola algeriensis]MBE1472212.1 hypothetical protein [Actinophytocola algeriensis]